MARQVCRDFQRGNCRFGTRCKFLHQTGPTQQRPQQNPIDTGSRQQPQQDFGANRFGTLATPNQRQQQPTPAKDHKCNNPKVCLDQIKEDATTEQPTFWRLTSYAHWKFLPNDISGDISPEELRALAYDSAKQGLSIQQIVQKEHSLVSAKISEFESLQRNPYRGPVTQTSGGLQHGQSLSSPFISSNQSGTSVFGAPQASNSIAAGNAPPQTIFGVPATSSQQSSGGFLNSFKKSFTNPKLSPSPFQSSGFGQASQFGQSVFGTQTPVSKNIFGSQAQNPFGTVNNAYGGGFGTSANAFGTPTPVQPATIINSAGFGTSPFTTPVASQPAATTNVAGFGTSPFTTPAASQPAATTNVAGFGTSLFTTPVASQPLNIFATMSSATPEVSTSGSLSSLSKETAIGGDGLWQKGIWKLGEIPEEEPPESVRF